MKILLLDAYSAAHVGNSALFDSSIEVLKRQFPDATFSACAKHAGSLEAMADCHCYPYLFPNLVSSNLRKGPRLFTWLLRNVTWGFLNAINLGILHRVGVKISPLLYSFGPRRKAVQAILDADIAVSISGEMLNDDFRKLLPFFLYEYWMAHRLGKLTIIFPQSFGPLNRGWTKSITRWILRKCDLVLVRDELSDKEADKLGLPHHLIPDVAITQPMIDGDEAIALLEKIGLDPTQRPIVGLTVSGFKGAEVQGDGDAHLDAVSELARHVVEELGGQVLFLTSNIPVYGEEKGDLKLARQLYEPLSQASQQKARVTSTPFNARQFRGLTTQLDAFVSTRMHASILSSMGATPTITINTQRKLLGFMRMIGQECRSIDLADATPERLCQEVDHCLRDGDTIKQQLADKRKEIEPSVFHASELVKELWEARNPSGDTG